MNIDTIYVNNQDLIKKYLTPTNPQLNNLREETVSCPLFGNLRPGRRAQQSAHGLVEAPYIMETEWLRGSKAEFRW